MNPIQYLTENCKYSPGSRIKAVKVGDLWKMTFTDTQILGQDTINYLESILKLRYTLVKHSIKNARLPNIIYTDIPKRKSYATLYFKERPYIESCLFCVKDSNLKLVRADLDRKNAKILAEEIGGACYYSPLVEYPSPNSTHYWLWTR